MKHVFCLFSVNSYSTYIYCPELYLFFNYTTCCSHLYCTCTICSDESSSSSSYNLKPTSLCSLGLKMKLCFHRLNECCIRYKKCVACILKYNISWAKLHIYSMVSHENLKNSVLTQGNNNNNKKKTLSYGHWTNELFAVRREHEPHGQCVLINNIKLH